MIEVSDLRKRYGRGVAVDGVSFHAKPGEILGFLGPNGAGKTTTMNMLTGYIAPTDGEIIINGFNMLESPLKARSQIGYLPDTPPLYDDMSVDEYLTFAARLKKVSGKDGRASVELVKRKTFIEDVSKRIIKNLSKGYRQRVGVAQAMLGDPKAIIFDEPTVGLDPQQIIEMRSLIKELGKKRAVILSSHILSEVSAVCDRVIIMNKGKIVASGTTNALTRAFSGGGGIVARVKGERKSIVNAFESVPEIAEAKIKPCQEEGAWDVIITGKENADVRETVFRLMAAKDMPLLMLKPVDLTLEEVFLKITNAGEGFGEYGGDRSDKTGDESGDEPGGEPSAEKSGASDAEANARDEGEKEENVSGGDN
ncbi:MAG: ABC transporter ATP-binding protein [Clostridiales bacterium]|nr:ABC transporter ATP-binding protein [Clostridiales bacterium]